MWPTRRAGAMDSAALMEELRRFNILLIPLDKARTWWRHHHLVAEFLASRRGQFLGSERIKTMHERASAWFETGGLLLEAVRHAGGAQDRKRMVALTEDAGCVRLSLGGELSRIRALFALLTTAEIDASARLRLVEAPDTAPDRQVAGRSAQA